MTEYIDLENAQELDVFVTNHPKGHYMQTSYYGKSRGDYEWNGIMIRDSEGNIIASIALHSCPSPYIKKRLFYAPRGPVCSNAEQFCQILLAAKAYCKEHNGYLLRIDPPILVDEDLFRQEGKRLKFRFNPKNDYSTYQPKCVYQTELTGLTEDELICSFHPKTRYNIRLAQRRGVTIRKGGLSDVPVFSRMMEETGKRDGFQCRNEEFYIDFLCGMGDNAQMFLAEKDGQVLGSAIAVFLGKKAWYSYGCSFSTGRENMPNYLLQWEMMRHALKCGCEIYDFRGVEGKPDIDNPHYGLHRFKQGFSARFVEYLGEMDYILLPLSAGLIKWKRKFSSIVNYRKNRSGDR